MKNNILFICQLPIPDQYYFYKRIKNTLLINNCYSYETLKNAMEAYKAKNNRI